jgi:predicted metal-dependent phosphoesterase TrpH
MWKVDLHNHTIFSKDSLAAPEAMIEAAKAAGLDKMAITEHNNLRGALTAKEIDPDFIIVGEEVMTTEGEIIAYFVEEEVPKGLRPEEAIERLRKQGAVISIPHPLDSVRRSAMGLESVLRIIDLVDAIEVFNARVLPFDPANKKANELADEYHKLKTAGSDAHTPWEVAHAYVEMPPFSSPEEFKESLLKGKIVGRTSFPFVHLASTYAKWAKRLKIVRSAR